MSEEQMTYARAIAELEDIVNRMQSNQCDIDHLAAYTKRSLALLRFCKERLRTVDEELKKSLVELGDSAPA